MKDKALNLYHGSPKGDISILELNKTHLSRRKVVFAGPRWVGLSFTGIWNDSIIEQGTINGIPHLRELKQGVFDEVYSNGGYLYLLPKDTFTQIDTTARYEWVSYSSVVPTSVVYIKDPIQEMIKEGVVVQRYSRSILSKW